ncbi:hypothetical protein ACTXT7_008927 [Hymenolepis weldensis]
MYEVNRAQLSKLSHMSNNSFDAICQQNILDDPPSPPSPPQLDDTTSRRYALSLLSRVAGLICVNLDDLLGYLLPSTARIVYSSATCNSGSPRSKALAEWGGIISENLFRTGYNRFIEGVPILRIVNPLALANLYAAAAWPTLTNRIQLFEENKCILEDLITRASNGFPMLRVHTPQMEKRFLKLIEFILSRSSHSHLLERQDSSDSFDVMNVDENEEQTLKSTRSGDFAETTYTTIPFIDESRLHASTELAEIKTELSHVNSIQASPILGNTTAPLRLRISKISPSKKSPENRRSFASDVSVTSAIQLALLLLPTELRFQMQVFFEQAQEVVANAKRHLRPETTLEFVQPSQLAYWFSFRFFSHPQSGSKNPGRALLEFLLSQPNPLALFKTPKSCLKDGLLNPIITNRSPLKKLTTLLNGVQRTLPVNLEKKEHKMDDTNDAAETEKSGIIQYSQSSSPLHPPTLNSKIKIFCNPKRLDKRHQLDKVLEDHTKKQWTFDMILRNGRKVGGTHSTDEKVEPDEANMVHVSAMLEYFQSIIDHKTLPAVTKLHYIKEFQKTHRDIFYMHFTSQEEAKEFMECLKRQAEQESHSSSGNGFANRLAQLFKRVPRSKSVDQPGRQPMEG